jgi:ketosteroid isomerase-like protein
MRLLYTVCFLVGLSLPALADDSDLKKQLDQISASYAENFNKKDTAGLVALWAPGGIWVNAVAGPSKLAPETYENMFKAGLEHMDVALTQIESLGSDTAIGTGSYRFTGKNPTSGSAIDTSGYWTATYVKNDGKWKIKMLMGAPKPAPSK